MLRGSSLMLRHSVAGSPGGGGSSLVSFSGCCCGMLSSGAEPSEPPRPVSHFLRPVHAQLLYLSHCRAFDLLQDIIHT